MDNFITIETAINFQGLDSRQKLKIVLSILDTLPNVFRKQTLDDLARLYHSCSNKTATTVHPINERIQAALQSVNIDDVNVAPYFNVNSSQISHWRIEVVTILYFIIKNSSNSYFKLDILTDVYIENSTWYQALQKITNETNFLIFISNHHNLSLLIQQNKYLIKLINAYAKNSSLKDYLLELGILQSEDPNLNAKIHYFNKLFRKFFFDSGSTLGFVKLYKVIFWAETIKENNLESTLAEYLLKFYKVKVKEIKLSTQNKYYLIKSIIEWSIREECNRTDYLYYLEENAKQGKVPEFIFRILRLYSSNYDAQDEIAVELGIDKIFKYKVTAIISLLSFFENYIMEENELSAVGALTKNRSDYMNKLRNAIVQYQNVFFNVNSTES